MQVWLPLLFSITMMAGMYLGYQMRDNMPGKSFFYAGKHRPIQEIIDLINNRYVDDVQTDAITDTAIKAMLSRLDPHSVFIPAEQLQQVNEQLAGKFSGIGIEFSIIGDTLNVIQVIAGGPGDKAGLQTGDKFLSVNDSMVAGKRTGGDQYRKLLRGERGTTVRITYLRGSIQKKVTLTRDDITLSSVDAGYMMGNAIGYIRLNIFSSHTYREFMETLDTLKKRGMQKLILDLRGNGGGLLEEAVEIADEFLDGDKLITYTEGKHFARKEYRCRREGGFEKGPLIVLADEGTASASEVLIGALQDWDRAVVIGRRTFGKGLVQEQYELSDHSALRLTIARYYTPIGRSIQRSYANGGKAYYEEIGNRYHDAENFAADSIKNDSSKTYKTALGKKVFGGGGITPDYFIAADTNRMGLSIAKIYSKGLVNDYGYKYYLADPSVLQLYKTAGEFARSFTLTGNNWKLFEVMSMADSIDLSGLNDKEKIYLSRSLKTSIARQLWRNEGYFEVSNTDDNAVKKALEILHQ